jgi:hypothetical protein
MASTKSDEKQWERGRKMHKKSRCGRNTEEGKKEENQAKKRKKTLAQGEHSPATVPTS